MKPTRLRPTRRVSLGAAGTALALGAVLSTSSSVAGASTGAAGHAPRPALVQTPSRGAVEPGHHVHHQVAGVGGHVCDDLSGE